jgi:heme/copper-type cytochrome/quinol oxidase subunit 4
MDLSTLTNAAFAGVAVFGIALTALAFLAFRRNRSPRMALVAAGFLLIAIQGVVVGSSLLEGWADSSTLLLLSALFEAGVLIVLFLATLVR